MKVDVTTGKVTLEVHERKALVKASKIAHAIEPHLHPNAQAAQAAKSLATLLDACRPTVVDPEDAPDADTAH